MPELSKDTIVYYQVRFREELEKYAASRKEYVIKGMETPQLASLMVQKYGYGIGCAAHVLHIDTAEFYERLDQLVEEIDPQARKTQQKRWSSTPAGLSIQE